MKDWILTMQGYLTCQITCYVLSMWLLLHMGRTSKYRSQWIPVGFFMVLCSAMHGFFIWLLFFKLQVFRK